MRNERGKISGTAMVLLGVVVVLTVGVAPILDFAYTIGLYAKPTAAEVEVLLFALVVVALEEARREGVVDEPALFTAANDTGLT